jgi:phosphoribosylformylglycinamidine synthase
MLTWRARIYVTLKPAVLDAQGDTVRGALESLGFTGIQGVRMGKFLVVTLQDGSRDGAVARVTAMCQRLLANPVIEDFTFDLEEA